MAEGKALQGRVVNSKSCRLKPRGNSQFCIAVWPTSIHSGIGSDLYLIARMEGTAIKPVANAERSRSKVAYQHGHRYPGQRRCMFRRAQDKTITAYSALPWQAETAVKGTKVIQLYRVILVDDFVLRVLHSQDQTGVIGRHPVAIALRPQVDFKVYRIAQAIDALGSCTPGMRVVTSFLNRGKRRPVVIHPVVIAKGHYRHVIPFLHPQG